MNPSQLAQARGVTYRLLSQVFNHGITADLLFYLQNIPQLAPHLPPDYEPQEAAAYHYQLFSYDLHPYEEIFLDPSGHLGGSRTNQLQTLYSRYGFQPSAPAGHIAVQLAFLSFLCDAQAGRASSNGHHNQAVYTDVQSRFLSRHLLPWIGPLDITLSFSESPFYHALSQFSAQVLADHVQDLGGTTGQPHRFLPQAPAVWQDRKTKLKDIANFLCTPPYAGFFLGRTAVSTLAHELDLPRGFGGRQQMLQNLLRSAAQYDLVPRLFTRLIGFAQRRQKAYTQYSLKNATLQPWLMPWQERSRATIMGLQKLHQDTISLT